MAVSACHISWIEALTLLNLDKDIGKHQSTVNNLL